MRTRATRISWLLPWAEVSFSDVCEVVLQIAQPLLAHAERNKGCYSSLSQHHHCAKSRELLNPELWLLVPRFCAKVNSHTLTQPNFITFVKELRGQHQGHD